ncbi:Dynein light chain [Heracleum sosnowskyi]|uniref:Dynein light chain n=1 Tax=Heracleum sosnowskyi TaxID=360622 RepID=A0AAD8JKI6_9APIA|nr:Dynein light chain [Heracleum sosnowskyi]
MEKKKTLKKDHEVHEEEKQRQLLVLSRRKKKLPSLTKVDEEDEDIGNKLKLDAMAIRSTMRLISGNMPHTMQEHALCLTNSLLCNTSNCSPSPSLLARSLKKEFDSLYGRVWHCIVGKSFGSFVTHSPGGFIYFSVDSHNLSFLLFKTEVQLITT